MTHEGTLAVLRLRLARTAAAATLIAGILVHPAAARAYSFISEFGCVEGKGAAFPEDLLPSVWMMNEAGYPNGHGLSFEDVRGAVERGVRSWEGPCCSAFASRYGGTTPEDALSRGTPPNVVSFRTSGWDELGLGRSTIAVTFPGILRTCALSGADILFNGVGFTFRSDGTGTDLESIAAHEFGHWLGLGHTTDPQATMYPTYQGGVAARTLEADDEQGVCALYPGSCEPCEASEDCAVGETCTARGICRPLSCETSDACPSGAVCVKGYCKPGCRSSDECQRGEVCHNDSCTSTCSICELCEVDTDCGPYGYRCLDLGDGLHCREPCREDADCPGDSVCTDTRDLGKLCVAPGSSWPEYCPFDYRCQLPSTCPGLWSSCADGCADGADACVSWEGEERCTCTCRVDADCGGSSACVIEEGATSGGCVPRKVLDPCWNVICRNWEICDGGTCFDANPCEKVVCDVDEECRAEQGVASCWSPCGECPSGFRCDWEAVECREFNRCDEVTCAAGFLCNRRTQKCEDACKTTTCLEGERCEAGVCVDACEGVSCGNGERCESGSCVSVCACASGETCVDGTCVAPRRVPAPVRAGGCGTGGGPASVAALLLVLALLPARRLPGSHSQY